MKFLAILLSSYVIEIPISFLVVFLWSKSIGEILNLNQLSVFQVFCFIQLLKVFNVPSPAHHFVKGLIAGMFNVNPMSEVEALNKISDDLSEIKFAAKIIHDVLIDIKHK